MTILDRYILKQFAINFLILFVLLFVFSCMVDLFVSLDRFVEAVDQLENADSMSGIRWFAAAAWMALDFYSPRIFQFYAFLVGIVSVGAMGFTIVQLHRHRELTAVLAAGVSLHRVGMPLVLAGIGLNLLQFVNREVMLPRVAPLLLRGHGDLGQSAIHGFRVELMPDGFDRLFYAYRCSSDAGRLDGVVIWQFDDQWRVRNRITADSATWTGSAWRLTNGRLASVEFDAAGSAAAPVPVESVKSDLDPTTILLRRHAQFRQMLSLGQISQLIDKPGVYDVGELTRIRFGRFSQVLINILTLLLTLPFYLNREPGNLLTQSVKCSAVGLIAQIGGSVGVSVTIPGLPAAASVFAFPLLILMPLAVLAVTQVET